MTFLTLDQKSHQEQLAVVLRELEQRTLTTPYGEAANTLWQAVFKKGHPFHGRVIGSVEDLNNASLADLQNFYDRFYGPSNASLALVGDFDKAEAKALINKYFSTLPKNTKKTPVKFPTVILDKEEIIKVDEKIGKLALVRMHYLTPALFESGDAELDIFGEIFTTRLEKSLTREKRLVSAVSAYQQSFEHVSVFSVDAIVNPLVDESLIIKEIDMVLAGFEKNPPTSAELMRAKNTIQTNQFFGLENIGGFNGRAELLQIYNKFTGTPDFIKKDNLRYKNVDIESLKLAIKRYLPVGKARKILIAQPKSVALVQKGN